ncbi:sensor histidine kinase [Amycolatopsis sp.]|uniref:sensor histidine kinase n=1 Tax=Amycolatopsis sp. TaxID=37632 RepID=UPI0039C8A39B
MAAGETAGDPRPWDRWWSHTDPGAPGGPDGRRWPVFGAMFLLPLVVPAVRAALSGGTQALFGLAGVLVYGACYLVFPYVLMAKRPMRVKVAFAVVMLALGWLLVADGASVFTLLFALAVVAFGLPPGWVLVLDGTSILAAFAMLVFGVRLHGDIGDVGTLTGIVVAMFSAARLISTVRHLRAAQEEIAILAVSGERQRLARDLHDILGHSLTTITVKAGLARRVLESAKDIDRAITEIREVEELSRSALSDVRATVSEYREVSLSAELVGARAALRAAEIDADLPHAVDNVRTELQKTFGYVLREAVTNVIRHSGAKLVRVRLGRNWMEISDDGHGAAAGPGNGLRGLRERLAEVGGTLQAESRPGGGFLVRAEVATRVEAVAK